MEGIEKVEVLKGRLFIPYSHVRSRLRDSPGVQ